MTTPSREWNSSIVAAVLTVIGGIIVAVLVGAGGRMVSSGEDQATIKTQIGTLATSLDKMSIKMDSLSDKLGNVYSRPEAISDQNETRQRFGQIDNRLSTLERRVDETQRAPLRR